MELWFLNAKIKLRFAPKQNYIFRLGGGGEWSDVMGKI